MPRDAFITALCKASLPPHYALTKSFDSGKTWVADASLMHVDRLEINKCFTTLCPCTKKVFVIKFNEN